MAIITLEDLNNFIEVLVFPKSYKRASELVKEDGMVYVHGRLNLREEEPKIVAEEIIPLEKVKEMFTKSVLVRMNTLGLEEEIMEKVRRVIMRHKGKIPVYIDLVSPEGRKVRLSATDSLAVAPSDEMIDDMEKVVGGGNVKFITK